jgi:hypothetical protein
MSSNYRCVCSNKSAIYLIEQEHHTAMPKTFNAIEFITATEPWLIDLVDDASTAFIGDTERAHKVAAEVGLRRDENGRYEKLVWMAVFP